MKVGATGLTRRFGDRVAVDGLSFEVAAGALHGFLGPNGAGKTTTFHLLTGLLSPHAGEIRIDGAPASPTDPRARAKMGVVFQEPSLDGKLTGRENLVWGAALHGVPKKVALERMRPLVLLVELADRLGEPVEKWSGGMRRRLELVRVLLHEPSILVMDEPTRGLDPSSAARIWGWIESLRRERGLTVLLTTHDASEAERCDRLAILDGGKLVVSDSPAALEARVGGDVVTIDADRPDDVVATLREKLGKSARVLDGQVVLEEPKGHEAIPRIVEAFEPGRLRSVGMRRPSLADVFVKLTGRALAPREDAS